MSSTPPPVRPSRPAARRSAAQAKAPAKAGKKGGFRVRFAMPKGRWVRAALVVFGIPFVLGLFVMVYLWVSYGRMIDAKLGGEVQPVPRIFGRPFEFQAGRALSPAQLVQRLNDIGYAQREKAELPGEFALPAANVVQLVTRAADKTPPRALKVDFTTSASPIIRRVVDAQNTPVDQVTLEAPMLTALAPGQKRRFVPLASIPPHVVQAVLAIEDRRFYDHAGVDPIRAVGALITNIRGDKPYLVGASTLTQQIVKNTFLTPEKTLKRKLQEQYMALVLDSRLTKDQILELYLNEVVLGQRGPFAIHGVGEAARIFFGKDVNNVSVSEAAAIAGLIQSPSALSPFRNPERARARRNVVLTAMAQAGFITPDVAKEAAAEPFKVATRALENEAPYFVDYVSRLLADEYKDLLKTTGAVDVYTSLDLHLQRMAQEAVAEGIVHIDKMLPAKRRGKAQVALIAMDPKTGEVLALVGGRSYSETQYNRAVTTRRQPGSIFKPFVYLAAFEKMAEEGGNALTPATIMVDEPTVFMDGEKEYAPSNYKDEYDGPMTLRRGLALSRNIVTIKVAEATGYKQVSDLWKRVGVGTPAQPYPSIALGVFEASPLEIATAYTVFTNGGSIRAPRPISRVVAQSKVTPLPEPPARRIARPETTYLVTNMMRSVINEGTAAQVRSAGFQLDAAGKTGTTNDLRDAWFVGFTPELLTVVWVGQDDNQPVGLSGSQAALPIWIPFMKRALAARPNTPFEVPEGIEQVEIDKDTGGLATPACPRTMVESFLAGTAPTTPCPEHGTEGSPISRLGSWFTRIVR